ncbi:MAG: hypothetical protein GY839_00215 [candidate division Zixibacteria bacterium]|nr:hypothetical protein [candidate division Zixibacteria bacterium]
MLKLSTALIIFILPVSSSIANIIHIPDDYVTIQAGINTSSDGDTVLVQPGTYVENINFNGHNIVLGSMFLTTGDTSYIEQTVIDGDSSGAVVIFENGEDRTTLITGFVIKNGFNVSPYYGGGVGCDNSNPSIIYNRIVYNYSNSGGGISCQSSSPFISSNLIAHNTVFLSGGGINCGNSSPTIINNTIIKNIQYYGAGSTGGINCRNNSNPVIKNNIIGENYTEWFGGAILVFTGSNPLIVNNTIYKNSAYRGGGIYVMESCSPTIINNTISNNTAHWGAGMFFEEDSDPTIINNILWADTTMLGNINEIRYDGEPPEVSFSNIQESYPGEGNINVDPLFHDPENGDFHLMAIECGDLYDSPCIDMGHPYILDSLLDCDWGLGDLRSDMGAYGGGLSSTTGSIKGIITDPDANPIDGVFITALETSVSDSSNVDGDYQLDSLPQVSIDITFSHQAYFDTMISGVSVTPSDTIFLDVVMIPYYYLPGDANMLIGIWPPIVIGADVTYLVNYFRTLSDPCLINNFYCSADINGDCLVIGSDVTRLVNYFRGEANITWCADCPPVWPTPEDLPAENPVGWPSCD